MMKESDSQIGPGRKRQTFLARLFVILPALCLMVWPWPLRNNAGAQSGSSQPKIKVRAQGRRQLVALERGVAHSLKVPADQISAAKLDDVTLLFASRQDAFTYLLISACGLSKMPPDDRQCGAGIECDLLWLKLDGKWKVNDSRSVLYESCWLPITSDDGYKIKGRTLNMQYSDLRENKDYRLTYDADRPEGGLVIEASPMKPDRPQN